MKISPATPSDLAAIAACDPRSGDKNVSGVVSRDVGQDSVLAAQVRRGMFFLISDATWIRGYISFSPASDHLFVASLAVIPQFRRRGLASRLLEFAEATARDLALPTVRLFTDGLEAGNVLFYQQRGYLESGRCEDLGFCRIYYSKDVNLACRVG